MKRLLNRKYLGRHGAAGRFPGGRTPRQGRRLLVGLYLAVVWAVALAKAPAYAQTSTPEAPPGFQLITSREGVWLFRKDYPNGTPDYVQVIDLSKRAGLLLLHAPIVEPRVGRGIYGGDDPRFSMQPLATFWKQAASINKRTFCVSNGGFFYMPEVPTRLAFPLKVDGKYVTDGFGSQTYLEQKLMLELWVDHAEIREMTQENLYGSRAPNIIAGFKEDANKRAKFAVGRTFIGIADQDHDRRFETILILNTSTAVQSEVAKVLRDFHAEKVMMLDGGGSTQLICEGKPIIVSERLIPQAVAVFEGGVLPIAGKTRHEPVWMVTSEGEELHLEIKIENVGTETWKPGIDKFVLEGSSQGVESEFPFFREIAPGASASFSIKLVGYATAGLYKLPLYWYIAHGEQRYAGNPIDLRIAVLASNIEDQQIILREEIVEWSPTGDEETEARVESWFQNRMQPMAEHPPGGLEKISVKPVLWVPAVILPLAVIVLTLLKLGRI